MTTAVFSPVRAATTSSLHILTARFLSVSIQRQRKRRMDDSSKKKVKWTSPEKKKQEKPNVQRLALYGEKSLQTKILLSGLSKLSKGDEKVIVVEPDAERSDPTNLSERLSDLQVSTVMSCSTCGIAFDDRTSQKLHYRTDWHRFNLKQRMKNALCVTEDAFVELAGDISSLSGTDFSDDENEDKVENAIKKLPSASKSAHYDSESEDDSPLLGSRQTKLYLRANNGHIVSIYRNVVCSKKELIDSDEKLLSLVETMPSKNLWLVFMIGGGHFAGAVFENGEVVAHKTFHRYVIRAKSGGVQSQHDKKNGPAKSGGANIRRHNEAALGEEINELLQSWSSYIHNCDRIFLRVATYNYRFLFGKKDPFLRKGDPRIRMIPFPTRRATYNEVKRVFEELTTVECFDPSTEVDSLIQPSKRGSPKVAQKIEKVESTFEKDDSAEQPVSIPSDIAVDLTTVAEVVEFDHLREFDDSFKLEKRKKKNVRKKKDNKGIAESESAVEHVPVFMYQSEIYTACKIGDVKMLESLINEHGDSIAGNSRELVKTLGQPIDKQGNSLLHIAAQNNHSEIVKYLLQLGFDPSSSDDQGIVPYELSKTKKVRNEFRMFMDDYPDRFDYEKAKVPAPLSRAEEAARIEKESEKQKVARKKRKEKLKVKKQEQVKVAAEEEEKSRYLNLSDREKRALAAERRLLQTSGQTNSSIVLSRCYQCAKDITGQIPFEYSDNVFCSTACLRTHRFTKS